MITHTDKIFSLLYLLQNIFIREVIILVDMKAFFNIAGGVALFLYGIKLMSEALQFIAGDRMRKLIGTLTKTPLRGIFVGILVTVLIQSSTGTTVMTVSFVNSGMLNLMQAIGIIMGANIGTTVTAQIIAFKIEAFALPLVAIGVVLSMCTKKKQIAYGSFAAFRRLYLEKYLSV